jgi:hypothetical protein
LPLVKKCELKKNLNVFGLKLYFFTENHEDL